MTPLLRGFGRRLADLLVRHRVVCFLLGLVLTGAAIPLAQRLTYNRSMEGFFPKSEPRLQLYMKNKEWFGGEATLIVAYSDPELWTSAGMKRQHELVEALKQQAGVLSVVSLADRPQPKGSLASIASVVEDRSKPIEQLQQEVKNTKLYQGVFVADDEETTAVWLQVKFEGVEALAEGLERVRNEALEHVPDAAVAGTFMLIHDVYEHTERDGRILEVVAVLVMGLVIAASFRSLRWVLLPLLIVYSALWWSQGAWFLVRGELTMVSSAISSLVAVTGVSTVVVYGLRFQELLGERDAKTALVITLQEMTPPVFWILATNAAGFGALLVCELKPVTDFAWIMLIASLLIGVAASLFLPLGVTVWQRAVPRRVTGEAMVSGTLLAVLHWVQRRPMLTALGLIVPSAVIGLGMLRLEPQTDFTENFRKSTRIYKAYDFIETRMAGAGQLDLIWDSPNLSDLQPKELDAELAKLRHLEKELEQLDGVTKVLGLVDFLDFAQERARFIPFSVRVALLDREKITPLFWNREANKMRITLQVKERLPSAAKRELIVAARERAEAILGADRRPQTTGIYVMLAHLIDSLLNDQKKTFVLSLVLQFVCGCLAFRSIWLALVAMLPTVLPVVAVVGTMGWIGLPVNIATAMLASVAMGMTINSSILYLYRFKQERAAGADFDTALARAHGSAGIAVVLSNLALVLGFAVLVLSSFIPLVHFGIFTSLAMLGGMVGNLVLLPLLLGLIRRLIVRPEEALKPGTAPGSR